MAVKHLFAVYVDKINDHDADLFHRLHQVLRINRGEQVILFDGTHQVLATITDYRQKTVYFSLDTKVVIPRLRPEIHWLLPLLKREAFEQAVYSLCEMGVTSIYPIKTAKATRAWGSVKDYARARTIMIAAAEQAKQFTLPVLYPVIELTTWSATGEKIFFDPEGTPLRETLGTLKPASPIYCMTGPEGDLTEEEKSYLTEQGFVFCALTPTVLRAQQAIAVGLGILRSYVRS
jgi:16S rRNA (uracil1498-N3)-methyltransferase